MTTSSPVPYFAPAGLFQRWTLQTDADGCTRIDLPGACVQTSKAASPPQPGSAEAMAAKEEALRNRPPEPQRKKAPEKVLLLEIFKAFDYLTSPPEPQNPTKPQPTSAQHAPGALSAKPLFPFDIQDIPPAMRRMGWHKSAALMEDFFSGALNYSRTTEDERDAIDQHGRFYASRFVDTKRFTWKWLLEHTAVEQALAQLIAPGFIDSIKKNARDESARSKMEEKIVTCVAQQHYRFIGQIDTLAECKGDVFALHRNFQFQVNKFGMFSYLNTDLGGSLGNFALYAAVAYATVTRQDHPHRDVVTVTHAYVYAKDNYSFNDEAGHPSQYLGHWNKQGVIYVPTAAALQVVDKVLGNYGRFLPEINMPELRADPSNPFFVGADFAIQTGEHYRAENIFYPVRNRDFWNWQMKHQRGSNILNFSDLTLVRMPTPLSFAIPVQR
ncbi:MAG: DUF6402 family protein [Rhodoferax sp.]|nr:DUF6402 family protein [Rhodoferax sp.]